MTKIAKFNVGDKVRHTKQGYRALIIDIDPLFQASGRYNPAAVSREFATKNPWYRLLVDESSQTTYVEECLLERDFSNDYIENPNINEHLTFKHGQYQRANKPH